MHPHEAATQRLKQAKNELIARFVGRRNGVATLQVLNTLLPIVLLTYAAAISCGVSYWLSAGVILLLALFLLRAFVLLHDCGHNAMFSNPKVNAALGFVFGLFCGMPQYVWSRHHDYHHSTNGNWNKYRGPLSVLSSQEYQRLTPQQQTSYARQRSIWMGPLAGFLYFVFNPRFTWLKGVVALVNYMAKRRLSGEAKSFAQAAQGFETRSWDNWKEFRHISANNLVLLGLWTALTILQGPILLLVYVLALSLAGAGGIILFTVQHNFENSYASGDEGWDYYTAALVGTSYLKLPRILHWFTADIGYHHVHHLSARIPNYNLRACHAAYRELFREVPRLTLKDVPRSMQYIIWDETQKTLITAAQFANTRFDETSQPAMAAE